MDLIFLKFLTFHFHSIECLNIYAYIYLILNIYLNTYVCLCLYIYTCVYIYTLPNITIQQLFSTNLKVIYQPHYANNQQYKFITLS